MIKTITIGKEEYMIVPQIKTFLEKDCKVVEGSMNRFAQNQIQFFLRNGVDLSELNLTISPIQVIIVDFAIKSIHYLGQIMYNDLVKI